MFFASRRTLRILSVWVLASHVLGLVPALWAGPEGGSVAAGNATISATGGLTTITQTTDRAVVNWQSFSTAASEGVRFAQPGASAVTLNRVTGSAHSQLDGTMTANGRVFLLNPNGVVFGATSQVNVGGLVASTLSMSDSDFMAGRHRLAQDAGKPLGAVINRGSIRADGGKVALVAPVVSNEGSIQVIGGEAVLAAGTKATVNLDGAGLVNLEVEAGPKRDVQVVGGASEILSTVVNNRNLVEAGSVTEENGVVRLGAAEGVAVNTGTITAGTGRAAVDSTQLSLVAKDGVIEARGGAGERGGQAHVLSHGRVALTDRARVDASGGAGGGQVHVGAPRFGTPGERLARGVVTGRNTQVRADALVDGDGGEVIVRAHDVTRTAGVLSSRGAGAGRGGFVETSGGYLDIQRRPDIGAANNQGGTWLIDPIDITITAAGTSNVNTTGCPPPCNCETITFESSAAPSNLNVACITNALAAACNVTVVVQTGAAGGCLGNVSLTTCLNFEGIGTGDTLHLRAHNNVLIQAGIFDGTPGGDTLNIILTADLDTNGTGNANIFGATSTGGGSLTVTGANINHACAIVIDAGCGTVSFTSPGAVQTNIISACSIFVSAGNGLTLLNTLTAPCNITLVSTNLDIVDNRAGLGTVAAITTCLSLQTNAGFVRGIACTPFEFQSPVATFAAASGAHVRDSRAGTLSVCGSSLVGGITLVKENGDVSVIGSGLTAPGSISVTALGAGNVGASSDITSTGALVTVAAGNAILGGAGEIEGTAVTLTAAGGIGSLNPVNLNTPSLTVVNTQGGLGGAMRTCNRQAYNVLCINSTISSSCVLVDFSVCGAAALRNVLGSLQGSGVGALQWTNNGSGNADYAINGLNIGNIQFTNKGDITFVASGLTTSGGVVQLTTTGVAGNNIFVNGPITSTAAGANVFLTSAGGILGCGLITGNNADFAFTATLNVGTSSGTPLDLNAAGTLTAISGCGGGTGNVFIRGTGALGVGAVVADGGSGIAEIESTGGALNATAGNLVTAANVKLRAGASIGGACAFNVNGAALDVQTTNGSININETNDVEVVNMTAGGGGNITMSTSGGGFALRTVSGNDVTINVSSVVNDFDGNLDITAAGNLTINAVGGIGCAACGALEVNVGGVLTASNSTTGNVRFFNERVGGITIDIGNCAAGGLVSINGVCGAGIGVRRAFSSSVTLQANGAAITDADIADDIDFQGLCVSITGATGFGTAGNRLESSVNSFTATTGGCGVFLGNSSANVQLCICTGGSVDVTQSGNIVIDKVDSSGASLQLLTNGGDIVNLNACSLLSSPNATLTACAGDIGASGNRLRTSLTTFNAAADNLFLQSTNSLAPSVLNLCGTIDLLSTGTITISSMTATTVRLTGTSLIDGNGVFNNNIAASTFFACASCINLDTSVTTLNVATCVAPATTVVIREVDGIDLAQVIGDACTGSLCIGGSVVTISGSVQGDTVTLTGSTSLTSANGAAADVIGNCATLVGPNIDLDTQLATMLVFSLDPGTVANVDEVDGVTLTANVNGAGSTLTVTAGGNLSLNAVISPCVSFTAGGGISDGNGGAVNVTGAALSVTSSGGAVGFGTDVCTLSLNVTGAFVTNISEANGVTLAANAGVGCLVVNAGAAGAGCLTFSSVSANTVVLGNANGSILGSTPCSTVTAAAIALSASCDVGSLVQPIRTSTSNLSNVAATNGTAHVSNIGAVQLATFSAGGAGTSSLTVTGGNLTALNVSSADTLEVTASGDIIATNPCLFTFSAPAIRLQASIIGQAAPLRVNTSCLLVNAGSLRVFDPCTLNFQGHVTTCMEVSVGNGDLSVDSSCAAGSTIFAAPNGNIVAGALVCSCTHLSTPNASLTAGGEIGALCSPFSLQAAAMGVNAAGSAFLNILGTSSVQATTGGSILAAVNGGDLLANIVAGTQATLSAPAGTIVDGNPCGAGVTAPSVLLFGSSVGLACQRFTTSACSVFASGCNGVFLDDLAGTLCLSGSASEGNFDVRSTGCMIVQHVDAAGAIKLESLAGNILAGAHVGANVVSDGGATLQAAGVIGTACNPIELDVDGGFLVSARGVSGGASGHFIGTLNGRTSIPSFGSAGQIFFNGVNATQRISTVLKLVLIDPALAEQIFGPLAALALQAIQNQDKVLARSLISQSAGALAPRSLTAQELSELNALFPTVTPPAPVVVPPPVVVVAPPPAATPAAVPAATPAASLGGTGVNAALLGAGLFGGNTLFGRNNLLGGGLLGGGLLGGTGFAGGTAVNTDASSVGTQTIALLVASSGGGGAAGAAGVGGTGFGGTGFGGTAFGALGGGFGGTGFGALGGGFGSFGGLGGSGFGGLGGGFGSFGGSAFGGLGGTGFGGLGAGFGGFDGSGFGGTGFGGTSFSGTGFGGTGGTGLTGLTGGTGFSGAGVGGTGFFGAGGTAAGGTGFVGGTLGFGAIGGLGFNSGL